MKLSIKFILGFLIIILISIFITGYISKSMIKDKFNLYLVEEYDLKLDKIIDYINKSYRENNYKIYRPEINSLANMEQVSINIYDLENKLIYSSNHMGNSNHSMMRGRKRSMMHNNHNNSQGEYLERNFNLLEENSKVGLIKVGFYDNSYITSRSLVFTETLNNSFYISGLISISIGLIAAIFLSKSLTKPLIDLTRTTEEIKRGNLSARPRVKSTTKEIVMLSNSILYLGQALKKEEDIRNQYAMDISHELRTPITTLKGYLEAISDGIWTPDEEKITILLEEVDRISNLVEDLRNSFLISSNNFKLDRVTFNLSRELTNTINILQPIFLKDNCKIITDIEKDIYNFMDRDRFKQVVFNLMSNAKKYIENDTGLVEVRLFSLENRIILKIRDNGVGIAREDLDNIFNRFYRVDSSRNRNTGGSGLGLSIVKNIVESHKGKIYVDSSINKGTEFTLEFKKEAN